MIKIGLSLIICSQVANTCLDPYVWPALFDSQYDCLMFGYEESINKMMEIGREEVNKYNMFIKFTCTAENII
jgi:hypothetical protein|tara:strand:- start:162 stop:377 length:216 start_codon:yes stop_codon:yes gene_type:complete